MCSYIVIVDLLRAERANGARVTRVRHFGTTFSEALPTLGRYRQEIQSHALLGPRGPAEATVYDIPWLRVQQSTAETKMNLQSPPMTLCLSLHWVFDLHNGEHWYRPEQHFSAE